MADIQTQQGVKFYSGAYGAEIASSMATSTAGSIVFDKTSKCIFVSDAKYGGGGLSNAAFANNVLKIWKEGDAEANPSISLDFSSLATTKSVMAVFNEIAGLITLTDTAGEYISSTDAALVDSTVVTALNDTYKIAVPAEGDATPDSVADAVEKLDHKGKIIVEEILKNEKVATAAFSKVQDAVGLTEQLEYSPASGANYISNAVSVKDADQKLDAAIKANETNITSLGGRVSALETSIEQAGKVDDVKIGGTSIITNKVANIATDGTYNSSTNKIATQTTVSNAIAGLTGNATIASKDANNVVTLKAGVTESNGVISNSTASDIALAVVAATGLASDVKATYNGSTDSNVQAAITGLDGRVASLEAIPAYDTVVLGATEELPTAAATTMHKVYLKPIDGSTETNNVYEEYITVKNGDSYSWEMVGTTETDLTGYVKQIIIGDSNYVVVENTNGITLTPLSVSPTYGTDTMDEATKTAFTTNAISDTDNYAEGITKLDNKLKSVVDEIISNEQVTAAAFNAIQGAAGLNTQLNYTATSTANYISAATSLNDADQKLDAAIKGVSNAVKQAGKVDDVQINGTSIIENKVANLHVMEADAEKNWMEYSSTNPLITYQATETMITNAVNGICGNKAATIKVNDTATTTLATVGNTNITAKVGLFWEEYS